MKKIVLAAVAAASIAGCATHQEPFVMPQMRSLMAFPEAEYAALPKAGTAEVTGQAFMKTIGGDVKLAAGSDVLLYPATSYTIEYDDLAKNGQVFPIDKRAFAAMKMTVADATGRFAFRNVPPGEYFVTTTVTWQSASGYRGRLEEQGGAITKRVTLRNGMATEVILTR